MDYEASAQPAGWYYAGGDPVGTHRYWDGTQWQGAPQPVAMAPAVGDSTHPRPAEYGPRFAASVLNYLAMIVAGIVGGLAGALVGVLTGSLVEDAATLGGTLGLVGFYFFNNIYLMGRTGQSVGKKQQKIKLVVESTGQPVGIILAIARFVVGTILTRIFFLDLIWIFIDDRNRRLTDKLFQFSVIEE